jgi:iron complex transport system ATP-binding protein
LREDVLGDVYHCRLAVNRDATGSTTVTPNRLPAGAPAGARRVHVIGGGGTGVDVIRHLYLRGCEVSCGALNEGDSDAQTAAALGLTVALEKPFSPLGEPALRRAEELAAAADVIVVCEAPFGTGNVRNLEIALRMREQGKPVLLNVRAREQRDYTGNQQATALMARLLERDAVAWQHLGELWSRLG